MTAYFFFLTIVLKSTTGGAGIGSSIVGIMMANSKYHPNIAAAKKQPPVATRHSFPRFRLPLATFQKEPAAKPKPIVAATKMRKKKRFVRSEQTRKTNDKIAIANG